MVSISTFLTDDAGTDAVVLFSNSLGGALSLSLAQCILLNVLRTELPRKAIFTNPQLVISAGAANWRLVVPLSQVKGVVASWLCSTRGVFILALCAGALGFICALLVCH